MKEKEKIEHKSFGMIHFSRINGFEKNLFGSELPHQSYIEMTVESGEEHRELGRKWYHGKKTLMKVKLTNLQFAELITSLNTSGKPCTISYLMGETIKAYEQEETIQEFSDRKFKEELNRVNQKLIEDSEFIKDKLKKQNLSKSDKDEIERKLNYIQMCLEKNIPYYHNTFEQQMNRVTTDAKLNIEGFITHKLTEIGLDSVIGDFKKLTE